MSRRVGIAPWLSVADAPGAVVFYKAAFGAAVRYRYDDDEGRVVVAQLAIDDADFWVSEDPDSTSRADAGPIRMILTVDDPDSLFRQAVAAGAREIAAVHEEHGWRTGRLVDPFGHHWEVARLAPSAPA